MLPYGSYVRVSKVGGREGDGFISPAVQESANLSWGEMNGIPVLPFPHELNVSGETMDRPIFTQMLGDIRAGKLGGIVVYKLDRFARTLLGALNVLRELGEYQAGFASATEPSLDYSTPAGRAFVQQMFLFAEFVRSGLKESWAMSQRSAVERGIHISPTSFLGYSKGKDGRLVPDTAATSRSGGADAQRPRGRTGEPPAVLHQPLHGRDVARESAERPLRVHRAYRH